MGHGRHRAARDRNGFVRGAKAAERNRPRADDRAGGGRGKPGTGDLQGRTVAVPHRESGDCSPCVDRQYKDRGGRAPRANPGRSDERRSRVGEPLGSGHLSGNPGPTGQGTRSGLRAQLRRLRRGLAQATANGLPAGRRPGKRAAAAVCRPRIRRSRRRESAPRLHRQGGHLRQRRDSPSSPATACSP